VALGRDRLWFWDFVQGQIGRDSQGIGQKGCQAESDKDVEVGVGACVTADGSLRLSLSLRNRRSGTISVACSCIEWIRTDEKELCSKLCIGGITSVADKEVVLGNSFEVSRRFPIPLPEGLTAWVSFLYTLHRTEWQRWGGSVCEDGQGVTTLVWHEHQGCRTCRCRLTVGRGRPPAAERQGVGQTTRRLE
jgi:hypothetical protein